ncbi:MAG: hypothetical protein ABIF10_02630 [Candidatus Woesearchaeota archaeon]
MRSLAICLCLLLIVSCSNCPDCICPAGDCKCPDLECPPCVQSEFNLEKCPKIIITKNVTFTRYVCADGQVAEKASDCSPVPMLNYTPIESNENNTLIEYVTVEPACVYGAQGGAVRFKVGSIASKIEFQTRTTADYRTVYTDTNLYEATRYFAIGQDLNTHFSIPENNGYLFRIKFFFPSYNLTQYSNEHVLDGRPGSTYTTKNC